MIPLSYISTRLDDYFGTQPSNDGCTSIDGQGTINCGVGTTLIDCERGHGLTKNLSNFSNSSDYFVWNRSTSEFRNVSTIFRFDQSINIHSISMWFWNAPLSGIFVPSVTLYDNFTTSSNQISIDTSDSEGPMDDRRYRLNVDITDKGLMVQSLRVIMTINEGTHIFLSEVLFCGK